MNHRTALFTKLIIKLVCATARGTDQYARAQIHSQQPLRVSDLTNSDEAHGDKKLLMQHASMIHPSQLINNPRKRRVHML